MGEQTPVSTPIVRVKDLTVGFGERNVLDGLSLDVRQKEILGVVGGSGSGKSVLMRAIIGLLPKRHGSIELFGKDTENLDEPSRRAIERRWGVMFQRGALFSSLTLKQNIQFQMREMFDLSDRLKEEMTIAKLEMVGLSSQHCDKMPSQLSGGMTKRAALARALALDPECVFLDEPTSGLDPISAADFDDLIKTLQHTLGLTVFMVTHDLESLHAVTDRIVVIADGTIVADGCIEEMAHQSHPWVQAYFGGRRGHLISERKRKHRRPSDGV